MSAPLQTAKIGLNMDPEVATYVAMLEGTIAALSIQAVQNRSLLELLTGDGWQAGLVEMNGEALQQFAVDALVRQTGVPIDKAKLIVAKRWSERNEEAKTLVPQAIPSSDYAPEVDVPVVEDLNPDKNPPASPSAMSDRLAKWKARQIADAEAL